MNVSKKWVTTLPVTLTRMFSDGLKQGKHRRLITGKMTITEKTDTINSIVSVIIFDLTLEDFYG